MSIAEFKKSALYLALPMLKGEIESIEVVVDNILHEYQPRVKPLVQYSSLHVAALKRCEFFYSKQVEVTTSTVAVPGTLPFPVVAKTTLRGREGIRSTYDEAKQKVNDGDAVEIDKIKPIKLYPWVFSELELQEAKLSETKQGLYGNHRHAWGEGGWGEDPPTRGGGPMFCEKCLITRGELVVQG